MLSESAGGFSSARVSSWSAPRSRESWNCPRSHSGTRLRCGVVCVADAEPTTVVARDTVVVVARPPMTLTARSITGSGIRLQRSGPAFGAAVASPGHLQARHAAPRSATRTPALGRLHAGRPRHAEPFPQLRFRRPHGAFRDLPPYEHSAQHRGHPSGHLRFPKAGDLHDVLHRQTRGQSTNCAITVYRVAARSPVIAATSDQTHR